MKTATERRCIASVRGVFISIHAVMKTATKFHWQFIFFYRFQSMQSWRLQQRQEQKIILDVPFQSMQSWRLQPAGQTVDDILALFQSMQSWRLQQSFMRRVFNESAISIHAVMKTATRRFTKWFRQPCYFNPCSHEDCNYWFVVRPKKRKAISIHAVMKTATR